MCGICGICGFEDPALVRKMAKMLSHRGPDQDGFFFDKNVSFGHRRLSIIDVSGGKQPISNEDETAWIVFNGEIYNYKELKKGLQKHVFKTNSDTEVILHLYEEKGLEFVNHLNGIFAFAIYDSKHKRVVLARDRIGTKPLYYRIKKGNLVFSSEVKSLLSFKDINKEISLPFIKEYLQFGFITAPNTILPDVKKVQPGEMIIWEEKLKKLSSKIYADFNFNEEEKSEPEYKKEFLDRFRDSVSDQLMSEVPLGAYLSGGLDSSSVVSMMRELSPKGKIKTFSVGFNSREVINELDYSRAVSEALETDHKEIYVEEESIKELPKVVYALDEPLANISSVPLYHMAREARKKVKVVLTGNGGDELFAGYFQHRFMQLALQKKWLFKTAFPAVRLCNKIKPNRKTLFMEKFISSIDNISESYKLLKYPEPPKQLFVEQARQDITPDSSINAILSKKNISLLNKLTLIELKKLLPECYLMVDDKVNMNFSIESRVPFLDNRMIELSERLPSRFKTNVFKGKLLIRKAMKEKLPKITLSRKKYGFTAPATLWFKKNVKEITDHLLSDTSIYSYVNKEYVKELISRQSTDDLNRLWSMVMLQLWAEQYIHGRKLNSF